MNISIKKIIVSIFFLSASLFAETIQYAVLDKHAFLPHANKFDISLHYNIINDTIDVLNLKEGELSSINKSFGEMGDSQGFGIKIRYSPNDSIAFFGEYERDNIDYSSETLNNERINLFVKYNMMNIITFDLGYRRNAAEDLNFKNEAMLNAMIKQLSPNSSLSIKDGTVYQDDGQVSLYDKNGNKIYPYISIEDAEDNSFYLTMIVGKRISEQLILDFYFDIKYTSISSKIVLQPSTNSYLSGVFEEYKERADLSRSEMTYTPGFNLSYGFLNRFFFEFNYEFAYTTRDKDLDYITSNHTIKSYIGSRIFENAMIYIGGQVMYRQFNNEIPYLYNEYSQTSFDHKYGYAELGVNYSF